MSEFHIPRRSELTPIAQTGRITDIKPYIERALDDDEVIKRIEPYKTDGGKSGRVSFDDLRTTDIIVAWDDDNGGLIRASGLNDADISDQIHVVLRRRYTLDKRRKIVGLNAKHYTLLAAPSKKPTPAK